MDLADGQLTYEISADLIQSMKNKDVTYRVDYVYYPRTEATQEVASPLPAPVAEAGPLSWFYWLWVFLATG